MNDETRNVNSGPPGGITGLVGPDILKYVNSLDLGKGSSSNRDAGLMPILSAPFKYQARSGVAYFQAGPGPRKHISVDNEMATPTAHRLNDYMSLIASVYSLHRFHLSTDRVKPPSFVWYS
jgi:hypothetical protein